MSSFCTDIGWKSLNKYGEMLCGDRVEIVEGGPLVIVLADGLGSGVKANILSTLTAKIISTMISQEMSLENCVSTIVATLPICKVRKITYSTFTIIRITNNPEALDDIEAEIIQYDNPFVIILRDGKKYDYPMTVETIGDKKIYKSRVSLQENDTLIAMSDGVVHAGMGKRISFGWQWDNVVRFIESKYRREYTAKTITTILTDECAALYDEKPEDDVTICTTKIRRRKQVNLLLGPPTNPEDDDKILSLFFSKEGKHIVCGGTTSSIAAKHLGKKVKVSLSGYVTPSIPPTAEIEGVDLATEGVVTISKVLDYSKDYIDGNDQYNDWINGQDGASKIARILFEDSTDINFYVGRAVNAAHQNPKLPIGFNIKMHLVEELSESLKKMGKRIKVSYF